MLRRAGTLGMAAVLLGVMSPALGDQVLFDFDGSAFQWYYDDFTPTLEHDPLTGRDHLTLDDPYNGWGGGGVGYSPVYDFSSLADGHFRVDYRVNPGNTSNEFTIGLRDTAGNQGKWTFNAASFADGGWHTATATTNLATPQHGNNDWQNLDLSHIVNFELMGQWSGASSFSMSFDNLIVQTNGVIERYPGQDPNAPWRQEAQQRIDQIRKANMQIVVRDRQGNVVPDAQVQVRMKQHQFGFGSALVLARLTSDAANDVIYRQKVKDLFNVGGSENDLKWPPWEGEWGSYFSRDKALAGLDWLEANDIRARGHVMVWPGYNNLPSGVRSMIDEYRNAATSDARRLELKAQLRQTVLDHIQDIGSATAGKLTAWDVINEPRANHDLMDILGQEVMVEWFNAARAANPQARLFINEYSNIDSTGSAPYDRDLYYNTIKYLKDSGAPIGGIGLQGHFGAGSLTGPEQVWDILDRFEELGLPIQITEYDLNTTDRQLQADYMRDFMTALFAHEGVTDFIQWGFWAGAHWLPEAAMFDENWNLRPHGQAYKDLVFGDWWTNSDLLTDPNGLAWLRGFLGDYQVTVFHDGQPYVYTLTLDGDGTYTLTVPEPASLSLLCLGAGLLLRRRRRCV